MRLFRGAGGGCLRPRLEEPKKKKFYVIRGHLMYKPKRQTPGVGGRKSYWVHTQFKMDFVLQIGRMNRRGAGGETNKLEPKTVDTYSNRGGYRDLATLECELGRGAGHGRVVRDGGGVTINRDGLYQIGKNPGERREGCRRAISRREKGGHLRQLKRSRKAEGRRECQLSKHPRSY